MPFQGGCAFSLCFVFGCCSVRTYSVIMRATTIVMTTAMRTTTGTRSSGNEEGWRGAVWNILPYKYYIIFTIYKYTHFDETTYKHRLKRKMLQEIQKKCSKMQKNPPVNGHLVLDIRELYTSRGRRPCRSWPSRSPSWPPAAAATPRPGVP